MTALDKLVDRQERRAARIFIKALREQYRLAASYFEANGTIDGLDITAPVRSAIVRSNTNIAIEAAKWQYKQLEGEVKSIGLGTLEKLINLIQTWILLNSGDHITKISDTTLDQIREQLFLGTEKGWGADKLARAIRNLVSSPMTAYRALMIARTETTRSASFGHKASSEEWEKITGIKRYKEWMATADKRTRDSHREFLRLTIIPAGEKFTVGRQHVVMEYPGDPAGGASEVINCRCRVVYMSERVARRLLNSPERSR